MDHLSETVRVKQLTALLQWTTRDRSRPHLLMGDFNTLAPDDNGENPDALAALRSMEWMNRVMAEEFQVVPRLLRRGYVDAAGATGGDQLTFPARRSARAHRLHLGFQAIGFGGAMVSSLADRGDLACLGPSPGTGRNRRLADVRLHMRVRLLIPDGLCDKVKRRLKEGESNEL